jgi:3'(2'), 5'-bisphosphate nucleotidase
VLGVIYVPVTEVLYFGEKETGAFKAARAASSWYDEQFVADSIPFDHGERPFIIVGSRSHMNADTRQFIEENCKDADSYEVISKGSSLKLCMVAEGAADLYPRFGPTMEWDTAAGHAIVIASGAAITRADNGEPLLYNKESLLNPYFIVSRDM